jgi:hypothetical protein
MDFFIDSKAAKVKASDLLSYIYCPGIGTRPDFPSYSSQQLVHHCEVGGMVLSVRVTNPQPQRKLVILGRLQDLLSEHRLMHTSLKIRSNLFPLCHRVVAPEQIHTFGSGDTAAMGASYYRFVV